MEIIIKPTPKQHEAWTLLQNYTTKFVGLGGGAGLGKSWMICDWSLTNAYIYPGSRGFIARNELKRLMNSTYITWGKVCKEHKVPEDDWALDGKYNVIKFKNGSTIDLLDIAYQPKDPDYERLGSTEYTYGSIEEAGETHFKAFDVLKSRVGRHNIFEGKEVPPKMLCTFNPSRDWVYRIFYKPWKEGTMNPVYAFVPGLYTDNPYTAEEYGKQLDEIVDRTTRERLRDGNWEYEDEEGILMHHRNIVDLFTNTIVKTPEKYLVVDVARFGKDKTKFNFFEGLDSVKRETYAQQSIENTKQLVIDKARDYKIPYSNIIIDEDGVGGGLVDGLMGVRGFIANSTPLPTRTAVRHQISMHLDLQGNRIVSNFQNLKTQCAFKLAELVENHKMAIEQADDTDEIVEELMLVKQRDVDKDGKLKIVGKDIMKESLGRSPDVLDTFIMRMYFELQKESTGKNFDDPTRHVVTAVSRPPILSRGI